MNRFITLALAGTFLTVWPTGSFAAELLERQGSAVLSSDMSREKGLISLRLADAFTLTMEVEGPPGLEVRPPDPLTRSPGWNLLSTTPAALGMGAGGTASWRQSYAFEPLVPGVVPLSLEPFKVRFPGEREQTITWSPVSVRVTSRITEPDLKQLRDALVVEKLPAPPEPPPSWPWLVALAGAMVFGLGIVAARRWTGTPYHSTPEEKALRDLDRLARLRLEDAAARERFLGMLADLVRRFIEKKYQLPASRRTTPEAQGEMQDRTQLDESSRIFLKVFLEGCDLAKFAHEPAGLEHCRRLVKQVRSFVTGAPQPENDESLPE